MALRVVATRLQNFREALVREKGVGPKVCVMMSIFDFNLKHDVQSQVHVVSYVVCWLVKFQNPGILLANFWQKP